MNAAASQRTHQGNRAGRGAVVEYKCAALSTDFGLKMLEAKFPNEAKLYLAVLGVYSRGPRKGLPRGYIHWVKVVEGGWDYSRKQRGVMRPGCIEWRVIPSQNPEDTSIDVPRDPTPHYERNEARRQEHLAEEIAYITETITTDLTMRDRAIAEIKAGAAKAAERNADRFAAELTEYRAKVVELLGENA